MRILWVKVGGLMPLNTGGRLRSFHLISELSKRHRVTVLTTHGPGDDVVALMERLRGCEEVASVPHALPKAGTPRFAAALAASWFTSMPVDVAKCQVPTLQRLVAQTLADRHVDVIVCDFLAAVPNMPVRPAAPVVVFSHNVEHRIWQRLGAHAPSLLRKALLEVEWRKMRRYEAAATRDAALTLAVSEDDRDQLLSLAPQARVEAIPTGVDTSYFAPNGYHEEPGTLVFTGAMDWYPNEDGVRHFVRDVLPAVRREAGPVRLTVVGRNPSEGLRDEIAADGVEVTGTVDDVRPHLARAAVAVVPLRIGGGTRLKIFEALAMGKAVVSTTVGAEGLPLVPGEHYVRADEPDAFARAVAALLQQPDRRRALADAGRDLVVSRYSWAQVSGIFEQRLREAVDSHAR
jgi:sugar transferase (PEP-CTERM/EpsH1 system associated)